ncbi:MAG: hypothetical protein II996_03485 [Oscillospiraceae bacterium]|nr:hypothetical protein [Oscillospiraceae bacterium]
MDTQRLKDNHRYYEDSGFATTEIILSLKEMPEFNIHFDEKYFGDIFAFAPACGKDWVGFTRDFHEKKGAWDFLNNDRDEITHIDEYLSDLIYYSDKLTKYEETPEVFDLITDFLTYAKTIGQNVIVQVQ